jgi:peptidoglycan/LPS O-acetylase OafA/YrhL/cellulose synthase/poly-beta-1,6-N-acetylglucosamine synthase-like glycosyltransferase
MSYLGPQLRGLLIAQAVSFAAIAYSMIRFSVALKGLLLFYVPITLYCTAFCISLYSSCRKRRVTFKSHEATVVGYNPSSFPSVDVFLPTAGEPLEVLANTYRFVSQMEWPGEISVWVLDDSASEEVRELCEGNGFNYRTRPNRGYMKKAGNLRFAFEQSENDFIAIFDADFVPRSDYLYNLIPYFDDPAVGIVQSPQYFDTNRSMNWLQRYSGATQELFYRWVQPGRDASNAAICVGTCAIYRREGLRRSGGFAQIGHSEDVHTGVNLMKAGYHVRYVPVLVAKGLCPDNALAFLNQQYRWCTGSMSLLADKDFHASRVISPRQKLCFWSGFLYYISTAINVIVAPLPALAMLWLIPEDVFPKNSLPLLGAVILWLVVLPLAMRGRWRIGVLRVQVMYSYAHALAIVHSLTGRTKEWVATGSAGSKRAPIGRTIGVAMKSYIVVTEVLVVTGLALGTVRYGFDRFWAMWCFAGLAAYVHLPLLFVRTNPPHERGRTRRELRRFSKVAASANSRTRTAMADPEVVEDLAGSVRSELVGQTDPPVAVLDSPRQRNSVRRLWSRRHGQVSVPNGAGPPEAAGLRRFRPDIQGLRAIAVTLVVLYHANLLGVRGGYIGVDVFFVISGFLITSQLVRETETHGRIRFLSFYGGRIRRLLVPAAFVVAVTLVVSRLWGSLFQMTSIATDAIYSAFYSINYHLAAEGINYQQATAPPSPLQHYWSLAVEEQFYIVWPLLITLCVLLGMRWRRQVLAAVLIGVTAASAAFAVVETNSNAPFAYFSLQTRAWELGAGALIALAATRLQRMSGALAASLSWLGLVLILGSAFFFNDATPFPGTAAFYPVAGAALVIIAGCRPSRRSAEVLLNVRPMQGLGRVSYTWYLWHWPMLLLIPIALSTEASTTLNVEIVLLSLWFAILTTYILERPIRMSRFRTPVWVINGGVVAGVTVAAAILVVASLPSFVGSGAAASTITLRRADVGAIQRALNIGMRQRIAPRNLTPTLTAVKTDQPASTANGCHADFLVIKQSSCIYGDPAGIHTLVLFGDSHAQQWLPALSLEGERQHWRVVTWTKAACPIAEITIYNDTLKRPYRECNMWRSETIERIESLHPSLVVMSQSDLVPGTQISNRDWADATAKTATRMRAAGLKVVYILDTPNPGSDVPQCVADHLKDLTACAQSRAHIYPYAGRHQAVQAALKDSGTATIDPVDYFCAPTYCPAVVGNILVYRDTSHMSTTYSDYLAPMMSPLFNAGKGHSPI